MSDDPAAEKQDSDQSEATPETPEDERRQQPRFAIRDCTVRHRRCGLFGALRGYSAGNEPLVNISLSGLQFLTNFRTSVDQRIVLMVSIPGNDPEELKLKGTVVWEGRCTDAYSSRVGVVFTKTSQRLWRRLEVLERSSGESAPAE